MGVDSDKYAVDRNAIDSTKNVVAADPSSAGAKGLETAEGAEFKYGFCGWAPRSLQTLCRPIWVLIFMCFCNVFQSMLVNGLIGVILTSLEVRFDLSSSSSSWIASAYDVSTVPMLILVSYFGSRSHRPRWTAIGLWILVCGTGIFVLPHFTTEVYNPTDEDVDSGMCMDRTNSTALCQEGNDADLQVYLWVFIAGRVLHGIGAVPLYTVCVTFLDDCVSKETFSLYIAIFYAAGVLGPALGYVIGGYLLAIYTDFIDFDAEEAGLTDKDPRWVGAWWLAFLVAGGFLALVAIPMSGYPRDLPGAAAVRAAKVTEAYNIQEEDDETAEGEGALENVSIRDFPSYLKTLLLNPTFVGLTLMTAMDSLLMSGFTAFGPKYLESQFAVTSSLAGILFGVLVIPGGAGGTVFGGYIIKRFKMRCAQIMRWEAIFTVAIMLTVSVIFVTCDPVRFAGINHAYPNQTGDTFELTSSCNSLCNCTDVRFEPICSHQDVQFYSPCHAGCLNGTEDGSVSNYYDCACIPPPLDDPSAPWATDELCPSPSCTLMPLWMAIFFVAMFLLFACSGMNISATVRCVPASHRSLAIGIQWIALRCLGTIPGPIVFGTAFDGACLAFEEKCGDSGTCLLYDNQQMALYLFIVCVTVKGASLIFILFAAKTYKPPQGVTEKGQGQGIGQEQTGSDAKTTLPVTVSSHVTDDVMKNGGYSSQDWSNGGVGVGEGEKRGVVSPAFVNDNGEAIEFARF